MNTKIIVKFFVFFMSNLFVSQTTINFVPEKNINGELVVTTWINAQKKCFQNRKRLAILRNNENIKTLTEQLDRLDVKKSK